MFIAMAVALAFAAAPSVVLARPASQLTLRIDTTAADATLDALANPTLTGSAAQAVARLPGNRALIAKAHSFAPSATEDGYVNALLALAHGQTPATDPFQLRTAKQRALEVRALLRELEARRDETARAVEDRVNAYSPPSIRVTVTAVVVVGGTSDGWASEDQGSHRLHLAAQYFRDDLEGLKLLMSHELYHMVQREAQPVDYTADDFLTRNGQAGVVMALLQSLRNEGMAAWVGDAVEWPGQGAYTIWYRQKFTRNLGRVQQAAELFSSLVFRAVNDPDTSPFDLYALGFSGEWDSSAYFLGYRMAKVIEAHRGRAATIALLQQPPSQFVLTYAAVANPGDPHFTPGLLALVRSTEASVAAGATS